MAFISRPFIGHYDSEGQLYYLMAVSLIKYGFFKLNFLPVNNSGLLTNPPDYYAHWPFLYPNLLAWAFKIFGAKIEIGRLITAVASTFSCWLLFDIVRKNYNPRMAFFTTIFFLLAPIDLYYSFWVGRTFLALALWLAAIRSFLLYVNDGGRNGLNLLFACIWFGMAAFISWEPVVTAIGLVIIFLISKDIFVKKSALICATIIVISIGIHHIYISAIAPHLLVDQINAYFMRSYGQHTILPPRPFLNWVFLITYNMYISFGMVILISSFLGFMLLIKFLRNNKRCAFNLIDINKETNLNYFDRRDILISSILLISMPLFWYLAAPRQAFDHDYECILWIPFISLTAGYLWDYFMQMKKKVYFKGIVMICIFILLGAESFIGFKRYYKEDFTIEYLKYSELKNNLQDTDILFVSYHDFSKPTTAYLTGCFVIKVTSKEEILKFMELKRPESGTICYFLRDEHNKKDDKIGNDDDSLLHYFKNKLRKYYKPLIFETYPELAKWIKSNFPRKELQNGLVLYNMNCLINKLDTSKEKDFK